MAKNSKEKFIDENGNEFWIARSKTIRNHNGGFKTEVIHTLMCDKLKEAFEITDTELVQKYKRSPVSAKEPIQDKEPASEGKEAFPEQAINKAPEE